MTEPKSISIKEVSDAVRVAVDKFTQQRRLTVISPTPAVLCGIDRGGGGTVGFILREDDVKDVPLAHLNEVAVDLTRSVPGASGSRPMVLCEGGRILIGFIENSSAILLKE